MKNRRLWAWLLLAVFLLGTIGACYAFFARNNAVVGISVVCILLSAFGTYYLRKTIEREDEEQRKQSSSEKEKP